MRANRAREIVRKNKWSARAERAQNLRFQYRFKKKKSVKFFDQRGLGRIRKILRIRRAGSRNLANPEIRRVPEECHPWRPVSASYTLQLLHEKKVKAGAGRHCDLRGAARRQQNTIGSSGRFFSTTSSVFLMIDVSIHFLGDWRT